MLAETVSPRVMIVDQDKIREKLAPFTDKHINFVIWALDEREPISAAFGIKLILTEAGWKNVADPVKAPLNARMGDGIAIEAQDSTYPEMPVLEAANALVDVLMAQKRRRN